MNQDTHGIQLSYGKPRNETGFLLYEEGGEYTQYVEVNTGAAASRSLLDCTDVFVILTTENG